jgi:uncharacterized membrane protein YqjE
MFDSISEVSGLPILIVLGLIAVIWIVLTVRSSRPKNR